MTEYFSTFFAEEYSLKIGKYWLNSYNIGIFNSFKILVIIIIKITIIVIVIILISTIIIIIPT